MGLWISAPHKIRLDQLALGLRIFVDTDRLVDGLSPLTVVYAVTASSYVNKYYILLGTEDGARAWYSADAVHGAEKLDWPICHGFVKLNQASAEFVNELVKQFQSKLEKGQIIKQECSIYS